MSMGCLIRPAMVGNCEISYYMANSIWRWELCCMVVVETNAEANAEVDRRASDDLRAAGSTAACSTKLIRGDRLKIESSKIYTCWCSQVFCC